MFVNAQSAPYTYFIGHLPAFHHVMVDFIRINQSQLLKKTSLRFFLELVKRSSATGA